MPASPLTPIPARQAATPSRITCPEALETIFPNSPLKRGGTSVPKAAQKPSATAMPRAMPRQRMVRPNVSPPTPHIAPKKQAQNSVLPGAASRREGTPGTSKRASAHGAMIQLKKTTGEPVGFPGPPLHATVRDVETGRRQASEPMVNETEHRIHTTGRLAPGRLRAILLPEKRVSRQPADGIVRRSVPTFTGSQGDETTTR